MVQARPLVDTRADSKEILVLFLITPVDREHVREVRERGRWDPDRPVGVRVDRGEDHPQHREEEEAAQQDEHQVGGHRGGGDLPIRHHDQLVAGQRPRLHRAHTWLLEARTNSSEKKAPIKTSTSEMAVP